MPIDCPGHHSSTSKAKTDWSEVHAEMDKLNKRFNDFSQRLEKGLIKYSDVIKNSNAHWENELMRAYR
ncbi:MAG: hypothetical protein COB76_06730 [Alphaproteobacteria bacterium]|nr:MAG: hypothetical protein COB76_06730 [Alphaproteobacteria bacterium]